MDNQALIELSESQRTAMRHLEMLYQMAIGAYKPKRKDDAENRRNAVFAFLVTGQCAADQTDIAIARAVNKAISEAVERLSTEAAA